MKKYISKLLMLMVLAALVVAAQACGALPYKLQIIVQTPAATAMSVSNIRMTTDEDGNNPTVTYSPKQSFIVFVDLKGIPPGAVIEAKWYSVNGTGVTPNTLLNVSDFTFQPGVKNVHFKLNATGGGGWPTGSYRVEIYLNGVKVDEVPFYVY